MCLLDVSTESLLKSLIYNYFSEKSSWKYYSFSPYYSYATTAFDKRGGEQNLQTQAQEEAIP